MTNDEIFEQLQKMEIHTARVVCDCAEQKSIEDLRRMGAKRVCPRFPDQGSNSTPLQ